MAKTVLPSYGFWTVLKRGPNLKKGHAVYARWWCQCICGNKRLVVAVSLRNGSSTSCKCRGLHEGSAFRNLLRSYQNGAADRKLEWNLTPEQFEKLIKAPCHYTGRMPSQVYTPNEGGDSIVYNGIDRKDNDIGYTWENCVSCCWPANDAKRDKAYETFVALVKEIYEHLSLGGTSRWQKL